MKTLGNLIRLARKKKDNMPLVTAAEKIGITYGVLQKIEAGAIKNPPEKELLQKMCRVLDISYADAVDSIYDFKAHKIKVPKGSQNHIPVIDWSKLSFQDKDFPFKDLRGLSAVEYPNTSSTIFGIILEDAVWNNCQENDLLVIEKTAYFTDSDTVLFYNSDEKKFQIRAYEHSPKGGLLKPRHEKDKTIFISPEQKKYLVGLVIEVIRKLK